MTKHWCIKAIDGVWCATYRNKKPDREARTDFTACKKYVMFRHGSERRNPTCPECKVAVARRKPR